MIDNMLTLLIYLRLYTFFIKLFDVKDPLGFQGLLSFLGKNTV